MQWAKPQGLLFETANPRHAHELQTMHEMRASIPQDKVLIPGALDTTTNFIEHPRLVAQRLRHFVDIVYAKLAAMAEGTAMPVGGRAPA